MARPIEPTYPIFGQDAVRLLESLKDRASDEEIRRRCKAAKKALRAMKKASKEYTKQYMSDEKKEKPSRNKAGTKIVFKLVNNEERKEVLDILEKLKKFINESEK